MFIHDGGVENVAVRMVKQARNDFIKGGKVLYKHLRKIPDYLELIRTKFKNLSSLEDVRNMYDAQRFVEADPYNFFGDVGVETVIKNWTNDAIIDYYKDLYLPGATKLYRDRKPNAKKEIYEIADSSVKKGIKDKQLAADFIMARNYIKGVDKMPLFDEWNDIAKKRAANKKIKRGTGKKNIGESEYMKNIKKTVEENTKKAKEFKEQGLTAAEISEKMGLTVQTIHKYLRS